MKFGIFKKRALLLLAGCVAAATLPALSVLWRTAHRAGLEMFSIEAVLESRARLAAIILAVVVIWAYLASTIDEVDK